MTTAVIPNRPVFRAQEVCELADVQPYVLRTWEAEFPDLGVAKGAAGSRVYRRADVERVLRIKHLLFVDGLTLAGARRRLSDEGHAPPRRRSASATRTSPRSSTSDAPAARDVRRGLQWILGVLAGRDDVRTGRAVGSARVGRSRPVTRKATKKARAAKPARPARRVVRGRKK